MIWLVLKSTKKDTHQRTSEHEDQEALTNPMPLVPPVTRAVIPFRDHLWLLKPAIALSACVCLVVRVLEIIQATN